MRRLRPHLTYANVISTLCLILVLGGGAAYAANTIGSDDVIDNSLLSADLKNNKAVKSADVQTRILNGADIADQSGVDTCTHGASRFGDLCALDNNAQANWQGAIDACSALSLRVPSLSEAELLADHNTVPNLASGDTFWTDEFYTDNNTPPNAFKAWTVTGSGSRGNQDFMNSAEVVCVTTPTN